MVLLQSNPTPKHCPPRRFKAAKNPRGSRFCSPPAYAKSKPRGRGRRAEGIRYEKRVQKYLCSLYGDRYLPGPWIQFYDPNQRTCQPDGLIFDLEKGLITLVEIKLRHCEEAYWQLKKLYEPVLRDMFPYALWDIRCIEIVRWYDPDIKWPVKHIMRENVEDVPMGVIGVHIYNRE